jgi:aspartate carbamoyltransferase catalytic subunit
VYSLLYGLASYDVNIHLVSPQTLRVRKESIYELQGRMKVKEHSDLDEVLPEADVIYVTRIQRERFPDLQEYEKVRGSYTIDEKTIRKAKPDVAVMHPLPRVDEISQSVDHLKNAIYFKQASYGKELRAALLALMLNESLPG